MQVVHHAEQRAVLGRLGQQAEHPRRHPEAVPVGGRADAEGGAERACLWAGQAVKAVRHRQQQLVERGEGKLTLGFDPAGPQHTQAGRAVHRLREQR